VQAGERISPAGGDPEVHLHIADGMEWLRDFVRVEVKHGVHRNNRATGAAGSRRLPSQGGGVYA
jgi:hypothetical protein